MSLFPSNVACFDVRLGKNGKIKLNDAMRPGVLKQTMFLSSAVCQCWGIKAYTKPADVFPH